MKISDNVRRAGPWKLARLAGLGHEFSKGAGVSGEFVSAVRDRVLSTIEPLPVEVVDNITDESWAEVLGTLVPSTSKDRAALLVELELWRVLEDDETIDGVTWDQLSSELVEDGALAIARAVCVFAVQAAE